MRIRTLALLAMLAAVLTGICLLDFRKRDGLPITSSEPSAREAPPKTHIACKLVLEGTSHGKDSSRASHANYECEDGGVVYRRIETHPSAAEARAELKKSSSKAVKVIESGEISDRNGKAVGERLVLLMRIPQSAEPQAVILRAIGDKLVRLQSSSLRHVLALEEQIYPSHRAASKE